MSVINLHKSNLGTQKYLHYNICNNRDYTRLVVDGFVLLYAKCWTF